MTKIEARVGVRLVPLADNRVGQVADSDPKVA